MDLKEKISAIEKFFNYIKEIDIKDLEIYLNPHLKNLENNSNRINDKKEAARKLLVALKDSPEKSYLESIFEEVTKFPIPDHISWQEKKLIPRSKVENENRPEYLEAAFGILSYIKEIEIERKFKECFKKLHIYYDKDLKQLIDLMNSVKKNDKLPALVKYNFAFDDLLNKLNSHDNYIEKIIAQTDLSMDRNNIIDSIVNSVNYTQKGRNEIRNSKLEELFRPKKDK